MSHPRRIGRICLVIAAVLCMPLPAAAQQWSGTPYVFWTPVPNRPDLAPPGGKVPDPLARCRMALRFAGQFHTPIAGVLEACPMLARAIEWEHELGSLQPYVEWDKARQERLDDLFQRLLDNRSHLGLSCPDTSVAIPFLNEVYLTEDEAFGIYAAHVANAIYLEATRRVPWSIVGLPIDELRILLASPNYFVRVLDPPGVPPARDPARVFRLPQRVTVADGLVCDPRVGYRFLSGATSTAGENLIGATEEDTLARIGVWMSRDVGHGGPEDIVLEYERQYSYLEDRLKRRAYSPYPWAIMAWGCQSAASFIHDLAKSLNIPLLPVMTDYTPGVGFHQGLLFHSARKDRRLLWHADDFYMALRFTPHFPIDGSGRALAPAAARRLLFDVNFVAPDVLAAHGYEWFPHPQRLPAPFLFDQPVIGTWGLPGRLPEVGYDWHKRYDLCTWATFVERPSYQIGADLMTSFTTFGPWPMLHSMEDFAPRADACAAAYGGYDVLRDSVDAYNATRGSNLFSTAPMFVLPPGLHSHVPR